MKIIKMTCATALMLLTMTALSGPSAMAESTALCKETPEGGFDFPGGTYLTGEVCPEGHRVTSVHETSVGKAKLLTSIGITECDVLFSGTIATTLASPLVISGSFTYTNCELGGSSCTLTEEASPAEIKVLKEGHETAKVTGEYLLHVECKGFIDCSYNGVGLKGTAKGWWLSSGANPNGEVVISEQSMSKEVGGFLCPKTVKLDITTTSLSRMFIGS